MDSYLRFEGITLNQKFSDTIKLGVENRGWLTPHRTHGDRVIISVEGNLEIQGKTEYFTQQFMIEKNGGSMFLLYTNTFSESWKRVEDWPNDPNNYVGFLEHVYEAASRRLYKGGPVVST